MTIGGEPAPGRGPARHNLVSGRPATGPDHDAAMRIGGEAPGRRAHSEPRLEGHVPGRVAATSDRHRRSVTDARTGTETVSWPAPGERSRRRTQGDALPRPARGHQPPQRDPQLPGPGPHHPPAPPPP